MRILQAEDQIQIHSSKIQIDDRQPHHEILISGVARPGVKRPHREVLKVTVVAGEVPREAEGRRQRLFAEVVLAEVVAGLRVVAVQVDHAKIEK